MKINVTKMKEMVTCFCKDPGHADSIPWILIDVVGIEHVNQAKVPGVTLTLNLTWNAHVDHIVRKASKRLYMLYQLKRAGIAQHNLVRVYVSVIQPVLEYACLVWHAGLPNYLTQGIEMVQKKSLKVCLLWSELLSHLTSNETSHVA